MKLCTYPITVKRESGAFYAYSEDFPGVYGLGKSIDGAKTSLLDGMKIYIEECRRQPRPVPRTRTVYSETVSLAL